MNIGNLFKIAVKALSNNKFRGFLTMLGIIIGVAAVITMLAIGQGSKRSIQAQISEMGSAEYPGADQRDGVQYDNDPSGRRAQGRSEAEPRGHGVPQA